MQGRLRGSDVENGCKVRQQTHFNLSVPTSRRCTSSTFRACGRHSTTVPFSNCPEDSWSLPRKTKKSLSSLISKSV